MKTLRPYQDAAIKSLFKYLFENPGKHPLVVAPVAGGKSLLIAEFIRQLHIIYPRTRIVMLTHVKELLEQNSQELDIQYFGCDMGFYCASLNQKRLHNDVTFASIQSVHSKLGKFNRLPEIIIVDECHLISHKTGTMYQNFINSVLALNPNCRVIGFTGTPFRTDTGRLDAGEGKIFDGIAYEIGMDFMIEEGYWAKPVCPAVATKLDVSGVAVRGGDYVAGELERKINTRELNDACVNELLEKGKDRKKWLVFTAGIQHAADVAADLASCGVSVEVVTGDTEKGERNRIISAFRKGEIRCLVNIAVLTTGFNVPDIDLLAFMRPTRSPVLYVQIVGRGVRPVYAPGFDLNTKQGRLDAIAASVKPDCMILDFGNVVGTLGPIDQISIKKEYKGETEGGGEAIFKICPSCGAECAAAQRYCYSCSYCFIKLEKEAADKAIMSRDLEPEWIDVLDVSYDKHLKNNSPSSLKVSYYTMRGVIREWICFEHHIFDFDDPKRFAWNKAVEWHKKVLKEEHAEDVSVPRAVEEFIDNYFSGDCYKKPKRILCKQNGKYREVIDHEFRLEDLSEIKKIDENDYFEIPF